jgi:hypothetical protein
LPSRATARHAFSRRRRGARKDRARPKSQAEPMQ